MSLLRATPRLADGLRPTRALRLAVAVVAATLVLAGCGLRLETPPPMAPSPDAREVARSRSVDDAREVARSARGAMTTSNAAVAEVLTRVAAFSDEHAAELGGVYDSGLATPAPHEATTAATPTSGAADPHQVLALLATTALTASSDAATVTDGELARLLASIAAARARLAGQLAGALGVPVPTPTPTVAGVAATVAPTPDHATASASSSPQPTTSPTAEVRASTRAGVVSAEDQAGYGFEVIAAKLGDQYRSAAVAAAAQHRARAGRWAQVWGIDGTASDPRRASYALPAGLDAQATALALAQRFEVSLTTVYASAVADAGPGRRGDLIAALLTADSDAATWGVPATAFPGLPERAG
jgi:hypothetical protein